MMLINPSLEDIGETKDELGRGLIVKARLRAIEDYKEENRDKWGNAEIVEFSAETEDS